MSNERRYEIIAPVGKGGFGTVYRAKMLGEGGFSKTVALKVLNENMDGVEDVARRLRDEARLLGMLRHRVFVQVDGLVTLNNRWTVVMEFIEGVDLKILAKSTKMPAGAAVELIAEVAGALHVAWESPGPDGKALHLLHRDIKPSNIQLTTNGETKLLDFGIARAEFEDREAETRSQMYGSAGYMAPERLDFIDGPPGDVYALGCVLFEVMTGEQFGKASGNAARHEKLVAERLAVLRGIAPDSGPTLPLLEKMLAYEPEERPNAKEVERQCLQLRRQIVGPLLREWSDDAVRPLLKTARLDEKDGLTGAILTERTSIAPVAAPSPSRAVPVAAGIAGLGVLGLGFVGVVALVAGIGIAVVMWPPQSPKEERREERREARREARSETIDARRKEKEAAPEVVDEAPAKVEAKPVRTVDKPKVVEKPVEKPMVVAEPVDVGTVSVSGSAVSVALLGGPNGREAVPGKVPAGTYTIEATFPDQPGVTTGKLTVVAGGTSRIDCDAFFGQCKVK